MDAASASAAAPLYGADAYAVPTLHGTVRATTRSVVAASDYRWHPPDRPPLFLLHAALLI
jgi:hypothetical protein